MNRTQVHFQPGDWVEVRPFPEILATLDARGAHEGLPFMPEMVQYCGRLFQVFRRAERVFLDGHGFVARLKNAVFLEQIRCDGQSHDGCQMGCLMFWKEAWLKPADRDQATNTQVASGGGASVDLPTRKEDKYYCQATELVHCTVRLSSWDFRQYARDYFARRMSIGDFASMLALLARKKLCWLLGLKPRGLVVGRLQKTSSVSLGLQPGELVEVKSREEIEATLDPQGRNRGLGFVSEMVEFCGMRFRVLRRVERAIIEWTAEMRQISDTVILDGTTCTGMVLRCCPRDCHHLWREIWLKRVE